MSSWVPMNDPSAPLPRTGTNKEVSPNDSTDFPLRCKVWNSSMVRAAGEICVPAVVLHHHWAGERAVEIGSSCCSDASGHI